MAAAPPITTDEHFANATIAFFAADGTTPEPVNGIPVWATSDATVISVTPAVDGMSGDVSTVAPGGPARVTITAVNMAGMTITGVSDDITVTPGIVPATIIKMNLGTPVHK